MLIEIEHKNIINIYNNQLIKGIKQIKTGRQACHEASSYSLYNMYIVKHREKYIAISNY